MYAIRSYYVLDPEKASSEYLSDFFNNPLGLKIRKAWEARGFILRPEIRASEEPAAALPELSTLNDASEDTAFSGKSGFSGIISSVAANEIDFAGEAPVENMCAESGASSVLSGAAVSLLPGVSSLPNVELDSLTHSKLYLPDLQAQLEILKIKDITKDVITSYSIHYTKLYDV